MVKKLFYILSVVALAAPLLTVHAQSEDPNGGEITATPPREDGDVRDPNPYTRPENPTTPYDRALLKLWEEHEYGPKPYQTDFR
jgi:hypothetical protein